MLQALLQRGAQVAEHAAGTSTAIVAVPGQLQLKQQQQQNALTHPTHTHAQESSSGTTSFSIWNYFFGRSSKAHRKGGGEGSSSPSSLALAAAISAQEAAHTVTTHTTTTSGVSAVMSPLSPSTKSQREMLAAGLDGMLVHLDKQLELFSDSLYYEVFQRLLRRMWSLCVAKNFESIALPCHAKDRLTHLQVLLLKQCLEPLREFFHAGGAGLPDSVLDRDTRTLVEILDGYSFETTLLISLYLDLENKATPEGRVDQRFLRLLALREDDKVARDFVKHHRAANKIQAQWRGYKERNAATD